MELSILQHAKDKTPQYLTLDEVAALLKGDAWPADYQPLMVTGAVVEGGLQKKNVRWLNGLAICSFTVNQDSLATVRQQVCDDPHTRLCFSDQSSGVYVVFEYELNDSYSREQQTRYYGKVQHFGMEYYARLTGVNADHMLVGLTKPVALCHDPNVYYNPEATSFHSDDISGKPPDRQVGGSGERCAKPRDIKAWLDAHVKLRRNVVTGRVEYSDYLGADVNDIWFDLWKPINDTRLNTLWTDMADEQSVKFEHMERVIKSTYAAEFHPFRTYLESLPKWNGMDDGIRALSMSVLVKGPDGTWDTDEQELFYRMLKKWLVGMVAGWLDEEEVNSSILVLLGRQGSNKSVWFNNLLPPELRQYFHIKMNSKKMDKEDVLALSRSGLVCLEELDAMNQEENNKLKAISTMRFSDERQVYDRFSERRKNIASYCGTGNNIQFLNDPSGNRRWLPFEVESITSPRDVPFDYEAIYAQAYTLYQQGFRYYFTDAENDFINQRNKERFSVPDLEEELVEEYFIKPTNSNPGEFVTSTKAADIVSTPSRHVKPAAIGRVLSRLGFESDRRGNSRGYYVVIIPPEERKRQAVSMANCAMIKRRKTTSSPDSPEIF